MFAFSQGCSSTRQKSWEKSADQARSNHKNTHVFSVGRPLALGNGMAAGWHGVVGRK
jgi:hypothetical protein